MFRRYLLPVNKHRAENDNGEDFFFIADICSPMDVRIYGWDESFIPPTQYCFLLVIWTFLLLSTPWRLLGGKGCLLKCKPTIRGLPEIKWRITRSQYQWELTMTVLEIQLALCKGSGRHLVILHVPWSIKNSLQVWTHPSLYFFTRLGLLQVIQKEDYPCSPSVCW